MFEIAKIMFLGEDKVINFAADELKKYLIMMGNDEISIGVKSNEVSIEAVGLKLGLFQNFQIEPITQKDNSNFDDEIYINVQNGNGIISGVNPRSVLLGVYRFLTEAGCRWVKAGIEGEIIPKKDTSDISIKLQEKPSYRHRGICIEGAVSLENVLDTVAWLPKIGLNSYFIQFREAYTFFERWYNHTDNPKKEPEQFKIEKAREFMKVIEDEIAKRGLIYHAVGHGWTCEPLGIPGISWETVKGDYSPEVTQYFALVNGERKMIDDIPLNLNLCYSNPKVRELMVNSVLEYLKINTNIDILHFWLADGFNNQCECENCKKEIPADFYVQILNELDKVLSENNINTKIVFLLYYDLLWTPKNNHIANPDRFIMMFAPITRTYTHSFKADDVTEGVQEYERNNLQLPDSIGENIGLLRKWKKEFDGDSFDFDYHFMWDHFYDPGYVAISKTIYEDVQNLKEIGLNGLVSCQCQRAFLPTGLGTYIMAKTLWNDKVNFDEITEDYFKSAFGQNWDKCFSILSKLSELFTPPYLRGEMGMADEKISEKYSQIKDVCSEYGKLIEENKEKGQLYHNKSWQYLYYHKEICVRFAEMLKFRAVNNLDMTNKLWKELKEYLQVIEEDIQQVFDLYEFFQTFEVMYGFVLRGEV